LSRRSVDVAGTALVGPVRRVHPALVNFAERE